MTNVGPGAILEDNASEEVAVIVWVVGAVVVIVVTVLLRLSRGSLTRPDAGLAPVEGTIRPHGDRAVVTIDLTGVDPRNPAVTRLLDDVVARAFATVTDASEVEVQDSNGMVLLVRPRTRPVRPPAAAMPPELLEPHHRPGSRSLVSDDDRPDRAHPHFEPAEPPPARPLADRFELPPNVRRAVTDPDDPVELVAALITAAGGPVAVDGSVIRRGDDIVIVLPFALGEAVPPEALSHAYRLFERMPVRSAVVVTAGHMDPVDVRRREALAPQLAHAGPEGIQRMADAVAIGVDPIRFVMPPHLSLR